MVRVLGLAMVVVDCGGSCKNCISMLQIITMHLLWGCGDGDGDGATLGH